MTKRVGIYELGAVLGEGSFGKVRMATNTKTKQNFAMKLIEKEKIKREDLIESLKKEISILMMIDHPNIVKLIEVLASKTKIYLVLEYIEAGELWQKIKEKGKIEEEELRKIFRQIIRALDYCKIKNIAHRDLKPENILLDNLGIVKVSDFGLSSLVRDPSNLTQLLHTTCGTVNYLAPEVIQNLGYDGHLADVWSLGVILFFCAAGTLPFEDEHVGKLLEKIVSANYEMPKSFSKNLKDLIKGILNTNPKKRTTLQEIKCHPWFLENISPEEIKWLSEQEEKFQINDKSKVISVNFENYGDQDLMLADNNEALTISPKHLHPKEKENESSLFNFNIKSASPEKQTTEFKPKRFNAFELMNYLSGCLINRIFDVELNITMENSTPLKIQKELSGDLKDKSIIMKKIEFCQQFSVNKNLKELFDALMKALKENQPIEVVISEPELGLKLLSRFKEKNAIISICCEIFQLYENLYLVHFNKTDGPLKSYLRKIESFINEIHELLLINEKLKETAIEIHIEKEIEIDNLKNYYLDLEKRFNETIVIINELEEKNILKENSFQELISKNENNIKNEYESKISKVNYESNEKQKKLIEKIEELDKKLENQENINKEILKKQLIDKKEFEKRIKTLELEKIEFNQIETYLKSKNLLLKTDLKNSKELTNEMQQNILILTENNFELNKKIALLEIKNNKLLEENNLLKQEILLIKEINEKIESHDNLISTNFDSSNDLNYKYNDFMESTINSLKDIEKENSEKKSVQFENLFEEIKLEEEKFKVKNDELDEIKNHFEIIIEKLTNENNNLVNRIEDMKIKELKLILDNNIQIDKLEKEILQTQEKWASLVNILNETIINNQPNFN